MSAWFLESELSACLQLLKLLASHDQLILEWLKQKTHKIQNKFLELMTLHVLTDISFHLQFTSIPFVTMILPMCQILPRQL